MTNTKKETNSEAKNNTIKKTNIAKKPTKKVNATKKKEELLKGSVTIKDNSIIVDKTEERRKIIITLVGGIIIGAILMSLFIPKRIAKLSDGSEVIVKIDNKNYTADQLYTKMKTQYPISTLLDNLDRIILDDIYKKEDYINNAKENADYYISNAENYYGYTQEQFLSESGFDSYDDFVDYLLLDEYRNAYYQEYVKSLITDDDIKNYYDNYVYGEINTKYIAVEITADDDTDLNLINEIYEKLHSGSSYDDIISSYKNIKSGDLGYQGFNSELNTNYLDALKNLSNNSYTDNYIETDYGYTIIFRLDQKEKSDLKDVKEDVIKKLITNLENEDTNIYYKSLIKLRENHNIDFYDTEFKKQYQEYCNIYK